MTKTNISKRMKMAALSECRRKTNAERRRVVLSIVRALERKERGRRRKRKERAKRAETRHWDVQLAGRLVGFPPVMIMITAAFVIGRRAGAGCVGWATTRWLLALPFDLIR